MRRRLVLVSGLLILVFATNAQGLKRASSLLEKKEFDKVGAALNKMMEKDSLNPGAYYLSSLLYLTDDFAQYNLDSSYFFINTAIDQFQRIGQKEKERLNKINYSDTLFLRQKTKIDSLAFQISLATNTITAYNAFVENHPTASEIEEALKLRNQLAFNQAKRSNTYVAYKSFMDTYPNSVQLEEAKEKYYKLLYAEKTKDGSLQSAENFLAEFPNSPFNQSLLKNIFELLTADNQPTSYLTFIKKYPDNPHTKSAINLWYYNLLGKGLNPSDYLSDIPLAYVDSIQQLGKDDHSLLIPFRHDGQLMFTKADGKKASLSFEKGQLDNHNYCVGIEKDILELSFNSHKAIYTRGGKLLFKDQYETSIPLSNGFSKIKKGGRYGLLLHSGWLVLKPQYDEIDILEDFIKVKEKAQFGLKTLSGRTVMPSNYQDIYNDGNFFVFEKQNKIAIATKSMLLQITKGKFAQLSFIYDDYQLLDNGYIKLFNGDKEAIFTASLTPYFQPDAHKIYNHPSGWIIAKKDSIHLYDNEQKVVSRLQFDDYKYTNPWLAIKSQGKWRLQDRIDSSPIKYSYDSLSLLNHGVIWCKNETAEELLIKNNTKIGLDDNESFQLLKATISKTDSSNSNDYLIIVFNNKKKQVTIYGEKGNELADFPIYEFNYFDGERLIVTKNGKKGLVNLAGKTLVPIQYEAISNIGNGNYSLLSRGKIGVYNSTQNITLRPTYSKGLIGYNHAYFIAEKSGKTGLVNLKNKPATPISFDKVRYWNDSVALVFQNESWGLYQIEKNEFLMEGLLTFKTVRDGKEQIAIFSTETGYGIIGSSSGIIIPPTFNDLLLIGSKNDYLFFCEKYIKEADWYVVIYYDKKGTIVNKQVYDAQLYEQIYCQQ